MAIHHSCVVRNANYIWRLSLIKVKTHYTLRLKRGMVSSLSRVGSKRPACSWDGIRVFPLKYHLSAVWVASRVHRTSRRREAVFCC